MFVLSYACLVHRPVARRNPCAAFRTIERKCLACDMFDEVAIGPLNNFQQMGSRGGLIWTSFFVINRTMDYNRSC